MNFPTRFLPVATFSVAAALFSTTSFASPFDGCPTDGAGIQRCSTTSSVSREAVQASVKQAEAAGDLRLGWELFSPPAAPQTGAPMTRAEVHEELLEAERHGEVEFGDLGRTEAELFPQRFAARRAPSDTVASQSRAQMQAH